MNREDLEKLTTATFDEILRLQRGKGAEYSGDFDALSNFKRAAVRRAIHPMDVLMVYMDKHLDAINTFVKNTSKGQQPELSEPIQGRIDDAINYLLLLKGLIHDTTVSMVSNRDDPIDVDRHAGCVSHPDPGVSTIQHSSADKLAHWDSPNLHRSVHSERHGRP